MKKQTLILATGLTLASLLLSGCGDDFAALETEFTKNNSNLSNLIASSPYYKEPCNVCHPAYDKLIKLKALVDKQWAQLEEIAKSDRDAASRLAQIHWTKNEVSNRYKYIEKEIGQHRDSNHCNYRK